MVKKIALISLAVVLMLAMANIASAKPSVANTSQKGSLLVFPKIMAFDNGTANVDDIDTYVFIGNDNTVGTWVKCYWMDNNQTVQDFFFYVTANQPVIFSSFWGGTDDFPVPPFRGIGTLTCWAALDDDSAPRRFNHLYGNAMIRYARGADAGKAVFYNAYSFAGIGDTLYSQLTDADNNPVGIQLRLTGDGPVVANRGYDACPQYLVFNFFPDTGAPSHATAGPDLTLWPCRQDLRQDRVPTCTKAKFDIWNENEVKFTGAYQCFKCFFEGFLTDIGVLGYLKSRGPGYGGDKFSDAVLQTDSARARVQGVYSTVCIAQNSTFQTVAPKTRVPSGIGCPNISADGSKSASFLAAWGTPATITPLLGVVMYAADDLVSGDPIKIRPIGAYTPFGAGAADWQADGTPGKWGGWIKYDPGSGGVEAAGR
jgi:hypothetical protein